ncbi:MAG: hypothetical protein H6732_19030 [Alphaproteobacteria bacterium]|nr:hypothetical protein [Alphaproteobacteria bacterium]
MMIAVHLSSTEAVAHPFGNRFSAQSLEAGLAPDRITVTLRADVPFALLDLLARGAVPADEVVLSDLVGGVTVRVDGQELDLAEVERWSMPDLVDGEGRVLGVVWEVPVDLRGRHLVAIGNANLAETPCWFRDQVTVPPGARVHATSLRQERSDGVHWLDNRWLRSERLRAIQVDLELPDDPWTTAFARVDGRPRPARQAWARSAVAAWREGRDDAVTVALALGVALAGSVGAVSVHGGRARVAAVAGFAVGATLPSLAPDALPAASDLPGQAGLLWPLAALLAVLDPVLARLAPWLVLPWLLLAVGGPWGQGVAGLGVLVLLLGPRLSPRAGAVLLLGAGMVALLR